MEAASYFYLALLVVALVPVVVLPWEGRTSPDWLYALLAAAGLGSAAMMGGASGLIKAACAGGLCLILASAAVTILRARTRARVLTGGQIKLLAAGATWLGLGGALAMVVSTCLILIVLAVFQRAGAMRNRPDASAILAVAILSVAMQQQLLGM